jgi:hypothetical protein
MSEAISGGEHRPRHPGGRPTLYREEYCEQARKMCLLGATNPELADFFDVAVATIHNWMDDHTEFLDAIAQGRERADAEIAGSLYHRAKGYSHPDTHVSTFEGEVILTPITKHYPPDTNAASLWLRNRQPKKWRDQKEFTGSDGTPLIPPAEFSSLEIARELAFMLTQGARAAEIVDAEIVPEEPAE